MNKNDFLHLYPYLAYSPTGHGKTNVPFVPPDSSTLPKGADRFEKADEEKKARHSGATQQTCALITSLDGIAHERPSQTRR